MWLLLSGTAMWLLWLERNDAVFNGILWPTQKMHNRVWLSMIDYGKSTTVGHEHKQNAKGAKTQLHPVGSVTEGGLCSQRTGDTERLQFGRGLGGASQQFGVPNVETLLFILLLQRSPKACDAELLL
uniref:Secreted protein n=1 Tax=Physcomitrium patens TaxID=3218 RepID=A0A7I4FHP4_PHYPA